MWKYIVEVSKIATPAGQPTRDRMASHKQVRKTGRRRGYITSTPKSADFLKKTCFWAKNERACCMPGAKNGERPYLAVPEPVFPGLFFGLFWGIFAGHYVVSHPSPNPHASVHFINQQHPTSILRDTQLTFTFNFQSTFHKDKKPNKIPIYNV